jgi:hypothetical protein
LPMSSWTLAKILLECNTNPTAINLFSILGNKRTNFIEFDKCPIEVVQCEFGMRYVILLARLNLIALLPTKHSNRPSLPVHRYK